MAKQSTFEIIKYGLVDGFWNLYDWFMGNSVSIGRALFYASPVCFSAWFEGLASDGHSLYFGPVTAFALVLTLVAGLMIIIGKSRKNPDDIPVPYEKFTKVDQDGVYIDRDRLSELVQYMGDLEDWLGKNGYFDRH